MTEHDHSLRRDMQELARQALVEPTRPLPAAEGRTNHRRAVAPTRALTVACLAAVAVVVIGLVIVRARHEQPRNLSVSNGLVTTNPAAPDTTPTTTATNETQDPTTTQPPTPVVEDTPTTLFTGSRPAASDPGHQQFCASLGPDTSQKVPTAPIPGRMNSSTVWTGHEMVVWSGAVPVKPQGVKAIEGGAAFDPDTGSWRTIAHAPIAARYAAVAVWTGSEMLVWGGMDQLTLFDDGAAYNPTTDTWRRISSGPLKPAAYANAIWTGSQMLVIGGITTVTTGGLSDLTGAGAAFDPDDDTWHPLPTLPAPMTINFGQLVWTGSSVVAIGVPEPDVSLLPALSTGTEPLPSPKPQLETLTPDAMEWVTTDTDAVQYLIPILAASAGLDAGQILTTGVYGTGTKILDANANPVRVLSDRPSDLPLDGLQVTTPIWTGTELLLWSGGRHGLAFNPNTSTWRTFDAGDMAPRGEASVVWTGECLIGWSGYGFRAIPNNDTTGIPDGIIYRPPTNQ